MLSYPLEGTQACTFGSRPTSVPVANKKAEEKTSKASTSTTEGNGDVTAKISTTNQRGKTSFPPFKDIMFAVESATGRNAYCKMREAVVGGVLQR